MRFKDLQDRGAREIQFAGDVNVTNTVNFDGRSTPWETRIDFDLDAKSSFGGSEALPNPRIMQFALRYHFRRNPNSRSTESSLWCARGNSKYFVNLVITNGRLNRPLLSRTSQLQTQRL